MTDDIVIVAAQRTAVGKFGGTLAGTPAPELGAHVVKSLLAKAGVPGDAVSEVIIGQVLAAGSRPEPGAPDGRSRPACRTACRRCTINTVCGSGLKAVMLAAQAVRCGDAEIVVAGGQENMSLRRTCCSSSREGQRMGDWKLIDSMITDGLWDVYNQYHMGITAENVAKKYGVTREQQDALALASQQKAARRAGRRPLHRRDPAAQPAAEEGRPRRVRRRRVRQPQDQRRGAGRPAPRVRQGRLGDRRQCLGPERRRRCGAGDVRQGVPRRSACSRSRVIRAYASAGLDPAIMGMGPVPASQAAACRRPAGRPQDLDLMEINEAFAAQACAVNQEMGWDTARINVNGGAIAIGHPIGASGCRVLVTLLHEMRRRGASKGLRLAVHRRRHGRGAGRRTLNSIDLPHLSRGAKQ